MLLPVDNGRIPGAGISNKGTDSWGHHLARVKGCNCVRPETNTILACILHPNALPSLFEVPSH